MFGRDAWQGAVFGGVRAAAPPAMRLARGRDVWALAHVVAPGDLLLAMLEAEGAVFASELRVRSVPGVSESFAALGLGAGAGDEVGHAVGDVGHAPPHPTVLFLVIHVFT